MMDTYDDTAKRVEVTYKNIIEELGPCIKHLVVAGRTYLKSIHGMNAAHKNYNDALSKVAHLAEHSMLHGSSDIGAAIQHAVRINKEMLAQQSNNLKSLEFDFLEPMEIAADKDTKLIGREQKRFQQLQKSRKGDFEKSISTLKKSRRKKSISSEKQLSQMKIMENSKSRLEEFYDESLKEVIIQERILYGTVLEKLCKYNKQLLIYHSKATEFLQTNIPNWESLAESKDVLPNNCFALQMPQEKDNVFSIYAPSGTNGVYKVNSSVDSDTYSTHTMTTQKNLHENESHILNSSRSATPPPINSVRSPVSLVRAKSEYNVSTNRYRLSKKFEERYSQMIGYEDDDDIETQSRYVQAIYSYAAAGEYQMFLNEGDVIEFIGEENKTGWQFGDNLTSKKSGWFPLSYTVKIENENDMSHLFTDKPTKLTRRPLPPPPLPTIESSNLKFAASQAQLSETSDYGSLKKLQPKILPVNCPSLSPIKLKQTEDIYQNANVLKSSLLPETPIKTYTPIPGKQVYYSNVPLQSMHL